MPLLDSVVCDYPLSDPADQAREFHTSDLGTGRDQYVITRDGRLIRRSRRSDFALAPVFDVEWPIEGDVRLRDPDPGVEDGVVEYAVRFTRGRVEWARRVRLEPGSGGASLARAPSPMASLEPDVMGRVVTADEFSASVPLKIELVDGRIPGGERLVLLLLTTLGLRRVAALVGREAWLRSVEGASDGKATNAAPGGPRDHGSTSGVDEEALLLRITIDPDVFAGTPIVRGHRLAVEHVLGMLAAGDTDSRMAIGPGWPQRRPGGRRGGGPASAARARTSR